MFPIKVAFSLGGLGAVPCGSGQITGSLLGPTSWEDSEKNDGWWVQNVDVGVSENVVYPEKPNGFADHWEILGIYPIFRQTHVQLVQPEKWDETRSRSPTTHQSDDLGSRRLSKTVGAMGMCC